MCEPSCSRETIADCAALEIVHRPDEREWLRWVRTRNRVGGNLWEGSRPTYPNPKFFYSPGVWQLDQSIPVTTVGEKENNVPDIRQFSYGPIRRKIAIIKSAQCHILDFAGTAGGGVLSGRNYETGRPANAGCFL